MRYIVMLAFNLIGVASLAELLNVEIVPMTIREIILSLFVIWSCFFSGYLFATLKK